ncbi:berberine bridge enzyme-like 28 [Capsicum annuum]|uniref:berberine bridge enzyme-like 28 n=1 Tax=Capsicum annuum TaxID=4072 RepID=UPI001FB05DCC|nr:berberine bridge enzyme-like 28 [Capsicum annuum]
MITFKKSIIFLLLSIWLSLSWATSASSHDDFLECLSHHTINSNSISQVIHTPNNSSYSTILNSFSTNLRLTSKVKPSIIITPLNESDIQAAIYCSKIHDLQIRIRSGGHDYEGLSYISDTPFVIIDLRNLRSISIDTENKTAWIQSGAILGEAYYRVAEKSKKLAVAAGVCPTVGVGGLFSGGGYSMLSRKFGIAIDNIIDAKLIDANGKIHDRESMGEDLFWAIRGGGGTSFGLIVSWKVKLLDIPEKVTIFNVTRTLEQNATQLVYKWQHIADKVDNNLVLRLSLTSRESPVLRGKRTVYVSFTTLYVGGVNELLREMKKSFPELGLVKEDCIELSWIESVLYSWFPVGTSLDALLDRKIKDLAGYVYFKRKSDYVQQPISIDGLEGLWKLMNQQGQSPPDLMFTPYGGKISDFSESETPFPHRAGNIYQIQYGLNWQKREDSPKNIARIRKIYRYMSKYVSKSPRAAYFNYRDLDLGVNNKGNTSYAQAKIWGEKYFKNNFDRLVKVKTKFDPTNFFRNEQSIPPLFSYA